MQKTDSAVRVELGSSDETLDFLTITGRGQAPDFSRGVSEPSVVLKEYIRRQRKR